MHSKTIGFIGGGNMATSLIGGLVATSHDPDRILVTEPDEQRRDLLVSDHGVVALQDNAVLAAQADVIVLAVKPNIMASVLEEIRQPVQVRKPLIISIAAGIPLQRYRDLLGPGMPIVRSMPNTPALVRAGMTGAIMDAEQPGEVRKLATAVLAAAGEVRWFETDHDLDCLTAVSGSGPAYFFHLMECMQAGAERLGLSPEVARDLVLHTAYGAAKLALHDSASPAELRQRVTSPGGTTAKALDAFAAGDFPRVVDNAMQAVVQRAAEMSREN
ncbi:pyrroline-5-carboxylate reductase [Oceanococcus atlanticus]|uniref:Pyrroline-5-carboxylate reductase n=1 Tax=Oceanococcus atlanticus TaxID=1317117 RepID=A0A1Y1SEM2_9GAMM|nr:pyrroline-5-carboxylate reductase [Oceanococcus atlanticus]ORE87437.1 pyrroline-5-carboxylate reductase [Oceanococcus atlanticus]RZO87181.1 MAG: pyrroline-5-carboxylate reductase [Oceanococcus sp.]